MSISTTQGNSNGIGLSTILFVVFLVLKLTGYIGWSWWWVTAPLWIPWGIFAFFAVLALIITAIIALRR